MTTGNGLISRPSHLDTMPRLKEKGGILAMFNKKNQEIAPFHLRGIT